MPQMRMFPLSGANNRDDEFDRMDDPKGVMESGLLSSLFHLQTFALLGCLLDSLR